MWLSQRVVTRLRRGLDLEERHNYSGEIMGQAASAIDEATGWTATTAVAGEALSEESATDSGGNSSPQERLLVQSGLSAERKDPDAGSEAFCPPESLDALLRCPICLETLQSPVVLYCGQ